MTDIESLVARLEKASRALRESFGWQATGGAVAEAIAAIRTLQTEKVELREALVAARKIVMGDADACRAFGGEGETSEPEIALKLICQALSNTGEME